MATSNSGPSNPTGRLAALLAGRPGVYRLDQLEDEPLAEAGWRIARLGPLHDLNSFYSELSDALTLPVWFGRNLDALWEVLVDLKQPTLLHLPDTEAITKELPGTWRRLLNVLTERADLPPGDGVAFALVILEPQRDSFCSET